MTNSNWICSNCSEKIELQFDACWSCGESKNKENVETFEKLNEDPFKSEIEDEADKKYGILKVYQIILVLVMVISALGILSGFIAWIWSWIWYGGDISDGFIVAAFIPSLISIFLIYCQYKIIDFLFYLSKKIK